MQPSPYTTIPVYSLPSTFYPCSYQEQQSLSYTAMHACIHLLAVKTSAIRFAYKNLGHVPAIFKNQHV